ncbi:serine protease [Streptomyces sp. NPDC048279]|uniref:trypsin-like serine peptidase n=1 Tax=Streptomyces sp. NPDC048279 TaxID=3154714 RepID=UPI00341D83FC
MDPARLVLVRTGDPGGCGSGYLVGPQLVLTALHVVRPEGQWAGRAEARVGHPDFGVALVDRRAQVCWPDPQKDVLLADALDVALLWLDEPVDTGEAPVRWGRPGGVVPVPFEGAGFPAFAADTGSPAHFEYLRGELPVVSTSSSGWVLDCPTWPASGRGKERPWEGASGSAIFCHGRLVGVVAEDNQTMGYRRLHAVPVHKALSLPGFANLVTKRGHPGTTTALEEVTCDSRASAAVGPVRSAYLRQVERIAPLRLWDRDAELAELADFCLQEQRGPYMWWRAGPWAGKSALLSTFVLNPPGAVDAGRVRLVSFFITARLAAQDTREAFTTVLTEQLCALLGVELQAGGHEATREAALLDLLAQAAAACQQAGGRLVLVVDGLDEDRGVTTGWEAHSIAGLLPSRPPAGMRVIVAGRPNPPIPDDVPDWHQLRDPGIIRLLDDSPHARDLQRLGQAELKRLLTGSPVEQDLLGLLTAARGGLSGPDLRELTSADLVTIEEILHTVAGRTFASRITAWTADDGQRSLQVYLLGHEELHNAAHHYLGPDRLTRYRDRLHTWAERYRTSTDGQLPWPPHTPEYLLSGYPRMLATVGDTRRLAALATDPARHDRMLDLSGGDTAALTEIKACQDLLLSCSEPDLYTLVKLSQHRGQLESSYANIPTNLPALWATLGQPNRAEQIARSITDPYRRAKALAGVAGAVAIAGDHERARRLATYVEQIAPSITSTPRRSQVVAGVAGAVAAVGDHERARRLAADAEQIARSIIDPTRRAQVLADAAEAVAAVGDHERVRRLAIDVEQSARSTDPHRRAQVLAEVAGAVAIAGDHEQARRLAADAEQIARSITDLDRRTEALAGAVGAVAAAGDHERAEQVARSINNADWRAEALAGVAGAVAIAGDHERARRLAADAEQIARSITDPDRRAQALAEVAKVSSLAQAIRLLGEAFALGSWLTPLPTLAKLYPQEMIRIADGVDVDDRQRRDVQ